MFVFGDRKKSEPECRWDGQSGECCRLRRREFVWVVTKEERIRQIRGGPRFLPRLSRESRAR